MDDLWRPLNTQEEREERPTKRSVLGCEKSREIETCGNEIRGLNTQQNLVTGSKQREGNKRTGMSSLAVNSRRAIVAVGFALRFTFGDAVRS